MSVVSVSLPEDLVQEMDAAIESADYRGRSEFVRAAVRDHLQRQENHDGGHLHGSITLMYPEGTEARISETRHAFHDIVLSMMHTHCEEDTCMDVLIVGGPAARVHGLAATLERHRDVQRVRLVCVA